MLTNQIRQQKILCPFQVYTKEEAKERILRGLRTSSYISTVVERKIFGDVQNSQVFINLIAVSME